MTMVNTTYTFVCDLRVEEACEAMRALLRSESVEFSSAEFSLVSTRTPLPLVSLDRRNYSRKNWVGLNPFAYVSGVEVRCRARDARTTIVTVRVNRLRAVGWAGWFTACALFTLLKPPLGAIIFVGIACAAWLTFACFLGDYLVRREIGDQLKASFVREC